MRSRASGLRVYANSKRAQTYGIPRLAGDCNLADKRDDGVRNEVLVSVAGWA